MAAVACATFPPVLVKALEFLHKETEGRGLAAQAGEEALEAGEREETQEQSREQSEEGQDHYGQHSVGQVLGSKVLLGAVKVQHQVCTLRAIQIKQVELCWEEEIKRNVNNFGLR